MTYGCETCVVFNSGTHVKVERSKQQNARPVHGQNHSAGGQKCHLQLWLGTQHPCEEVQMDRTHSSGWTIKTDLSSGGRTAQARSARQHSYGHSPALQSDGLDNSSEWPTNMGIHVKENLVIEHNYLHLVCSIYLSTLKMEIEIYTEIERKIIA